MSGEYARVLYNFASPEQGDLSLEEGDIVQILKQDGNWLLGRLHGNVGNFPANFVQALALPNVGCGQKLFATIKNFRAQEDGDLAFNRGEFVFLSSGLCKAMSQQYFAVLSKEKWSSENCRAFASSYVTSWQSSSLIYLTPAFSNLLRKGP